MTRRDREDEGGMVEALKRLAAFLGQPLFFRYDSRAGRDRRVVDRGDRSFEHPKSEDACATFLMILTGLIVAGIIIAIVRGCAS